MDQQEGQNLMALRNEILYLHDKLVHQKNSQNSNEKNSKFSDVQIEEEPKPREFKELLEPVILQNPTITVPSIII